MNSAHEQCTTECTVAVWSCAQCAHSALCRARTTCYGACGCTLLPHALSVVAHAGRVLGHDTVPCRLCCDRENSVATGTLEKLVATYRDWEKCVTKRALEKPVMTEFPLL